MKMLFPGIVKIFTCNANSLDELLREKAIAGFVPEIPSILSEICSFTSAYAENVTDAINNGNIDTAKLNFFSQSKLSLRDGLCFVFNDVDGNNYLMGAKERPWPAISEKFVNGSPGESSRGYEYSISLKSIKSIIALKPDSEDSDISSLFN